MEQKGIENILKQYWGFDHFRGVQLPVIEAVLRGEDVMALMPTGGGKSLCFQVPALLRPGICLVVSPLIALMTDQVLSLQQKGINAVALHNGLSRQEVDDIYTLLEDGYCQFLYVSPERLDSISFLQKIDQMSIQLLVVDEAHCIAEWGYDFRPAYLKIGAFRKQIGKVPCLALTASATPAVQKDILAQLKMPSASVFKQDFLRPDLSYDVQLCVNETDKKEALVSVIRDSDKASMLIYARSRRSVEELSAWLNASGYKSSYYHAGLSSELRRQRQQEWLVDTHHIMVCTSAFGMGIDKPDVRVVVHYGPTDNLEAYYQQAGRAGRDRKAARAILLYTEADLDFLDKLSLILYPPFKIIQKFYQNLADYLQLPVGLGEDRFFSFQMTDFAKRFHWTPLQVHSILKGLEQSGLITYLEQVYLPAKLKILVGRSQVEAISVTAPKEGEILDYIMRHYDHIFIEAITISERQIAWGVYLDEAYDRKVLLRLHHAGYLYYLPARSLPQVHFLTGRAPASSLLFDHEKYRKRKQWFEWRLEMLKRYLKQDQKCRVEMLAAYFGQSTTAICGICDNCRHRKEPSL